MKINESTIKKINEIGISLSRESNLNVLLDNILTSCRDLTNADAGSLYLLIENTHLKFEIVQTESLNIHIGGTSDEVINLPFIPLYDAQGKENNKLVVVYTVLNDQTVNIDDVNTTELFDFSGTKEFDKKFSYKTQSILTIPMKDHHSKLLGAVQLINAIDDETGSVCSFSPLDQSIAESFTSQAAIALSRKKLEDTLQRYVSLQSTLNNILRLGYIYQDYLELIDSILNILTKLTITVPILAYAIKLNDNHEKNRPDNQDNILSRYFSDKELKHIAEKNLLYSDEVQLLENIDDKDYYVLSLQHHGFIIMAVKHGDKVTFEEEMFLETIIESIDMVLNSVSK